MELPKYRVLLGEERLVPLQVGLGALALLQSPFSSPAKSAECAESLR